MKTTIIRKIKRPDGVGRWPAYVVSEDSFGLWLYSPKGTIYRGQTGSVITQCQDLLDIAELQVVRSDPNSDP